MLRLQCWDPHVYQGTSKPAFEVSCACTAYRELEHWHSSDEHATGTWAGVIPYYGLESRHIFLTAGNDVIVTRLGMKVTGDEDGR